MRFAWLRENGQITTAPVQTSSNRLLIVTYNIIWWLPLVLVVLGAIDYQIGFATFAAITAIRLAANLYRNNILPIDKAETFPLRTP